MEQENHPNSQEFLNCFHCEENVDPSIRARWNCGRMPPHNRTGPGFPNPPHWGPDCSVCPGYLITLPQVIETARVRSHWKHGCIKERYEDAPLTGLLFECIDFLDNSVQNLEARLCNRQAGE